MTKQRQRVYIKLKGFDRQLIDRSVRSIIVTVKKNGATGSSIKGPIFLPNRITKITVNRSPHVDKKSREQFEIRVHKRLIILIATSMTVQALQSLMLPAGVDVEMKVQGGDNE